MYSTNVRKKWGNFLQGDHFVEELALTFISSPDTGK